MAPFFVVLAIGLIAYWFFEIETNDPRIAFAICLGALFFLMATRSPSVGTDTAASIGLFVATGTADIPTSSSEAFEFWIFAPVYALWCKFIWLVCANEQAIVIANSIMICTGYGVFFWRFARRKSAALILWLLSFSYFDAYNAMRQELATALCLLFFVMLMEKKNVIAVLFAICSLGIHIALAPVVILVFLAAKLSMRHTINLNSAFLIVAVVAVLARWMFEPMCTLIFSLMGRYGDLYGEIAMSYTTKGRAVVIPLAALCLLLVFLFNRQHNEDGDTIDCGESAVFVLAFIWMAIAIAFYDLALMLRIANMLLPFGVCAVANADARIDGKSNTALATTLTHAFLLCTFSAMLIIGIGGVVPYSFFWQY